MHSAILNSFAKINIGLRVLDKREDGFHNLETIFYPVKLHDEINIEIQKSETNFNSVILRSSKSFIPLTRDNLCYKAVEYFFKEFKIHDCYKVNIYLKKIIPVGGGLGGGSSNAAAIIKFLIRYLNIDIISNRSLIMNLALSIGSDVPFFLMLKPCYAGGRGEKIKLLPDFRIHKDILIVNPNLHVSTRWAFEKLDFKKDISKEAVLGSVTNFNDSNPDIFINDFEGIVFQKFHELKVIKEEMISMGATFSSMSGTGATMYGMFDKNKKGTLRKCRDYYEAKKYFTFISD